MTESRTRIRARRDGWATHEKLTLTDRDARILHVIGTCGIVRTADITRFFFGTRATANDRLRKLYCAGLVDVHVPDLSADNHYTLTALGRDRVLEAFDLDVDALQIVKKLPAKLGHRLAVTEVRLAVALACERSSTYALAAFETEVDLARERHAALLDLIPDAKIRVRTRASGEENVFFLEVDLGTEAVTWLVRRKLAVYARHALTGTALYGVRDPLIVLVVESLRRARNVARALAAASVGTRVVFALRPTLTAGNVLGVAYALPADLLANAAGTDAANLFPRRLLP